MGPLKLALFIVTLTVTCSRGLWIPTEHDVTAQNAHARRALASKHHPGYKESVYTTRFSNVTWDNERWMLETTQFDPGHYQSRMSTANGYIGINCASVGPFYEADSPVDGDNINGWPLFSERQTFAGIGGFWNQQAETNGSNYPWILEKGGESVISGLPHWGGLIIELDNGRFLDAKVDPQELSRGSMAYDFQHGVETWRYTWTPVDSSGISFDLEYSLFTHRLYVNQGLVDLKIQPSQDCNVSIVNVLDGRSAVRTDFVSSGIDNRLIYSAVRPTGVSNVTAYVYAGINGTDEVDFSTLRSITDKPYIGTNDSTIAQTVRASLKAGKVTAVTKFVGIASTDGFADAQAQAKKNSLQGMGLGFEASYACHAAQWEKGMPKDSVDDYSNPETGLLPVDVNLVEKQISAVVNTHMILMNLLTPDALVAVDDAPIDSNGVSVCGLGSDCYAGLVFWDQEQFMLPGIVPSHPAESIQIPNYRAARFQQAKANVATAYQSSKNSTTFSSEAAVYPWTSGRTGNCTGTGPCFDYEYHINGDIVEGFLYYLASSGNQPFFQQTLFPIINSISTFFSELLQKNGTQYILTNMTDPDEYANNVDNGGFTMALIAQTLSTTNSLLEASKQSRNPTFADQATNILIPEDTTAGIRLEYSGMNGSISVKQADVILTTFPLDFNQNYPPAAKLRDLDYYARKQTQKGPAMTYAVFSIGASAVSPSGCSAYTYDLYATIPYVRGPWFQLSEQLGDAFERNGGVHPAFPFLTGHGGALQVNVYGYLGLRYLVDDVLHVDPVLPPQIPYLRYRTFHWQGWPIAAVANQTHTTLRRLGVPVRDANPVYATRPISVQVGDSDSSSSSKSTPFLLAPNRTLVLPNRQSFTALTVPGNLLQCRSVTSEDPYLPGQFPLGAVDGAVSTKWQPGRANVAQAITVDTSGVPFQRVAGLGFDWGQNPPVRARVVFHNGSDYGGGAAGAGAGGVVEIGNVEISERWDAVRESLVEGYRSNTTNVTVRGEEMWSGRFATLVIWGNQGDRADNATGASVAEWVVLGRGGAVVV